MVTHTLFRFIAKDLIIPLADKVKHLYMCLLDDHVKVIVMGFNP
jgi:hypothetical protein